MQRQMTLPFFTGPGFLLAFFIFALPELNGSAAQAEDAPQGIPRNAVQFEVAGLEHVKMFASGNSLYTEIKAAKDDSSLKIPRLANVVQSITWQSAPESKISLQPEPDHWIIRHGKPAAESGDVLVIALDAPPKAFDSSMVTQANEAGVIFLPAKLAMTTGENLRYEPQPHKNTVGYWSNVKATAEWKFSSPAKGSYEIDILQGCGTGHGGSEVNVTIENDVRSFVVEETGHFQNFVWRTVGTASLSADEIMTLRLSPQKKPGGAVMDVRAVRLCPVGSKRSFEPELASPESLPPKFRSPVVAE